MSSNTRGRKHVKLDETALSEIALESGATDNRLALYFGVDPKTMTANYSKLLAQKRAERKIAIARAQYRRAIRGDSTLLIWLGKVELGQTDRQIHDLPGVEKALYEISDKFLPQVQRGHVKK